MDTATKSQAKYRVMGTNDDASECCCCGRQGLKMVVWMQALDESGEDSGVPVPFGRVCAAKASGWGYGSTSDIDRRIARELAASSKHYAALASDRIANMERAGLLVKIRVAFNFDWKLGTHSYGYIYTLPNDPIAAMGPVDQAAEIKHAKQRRNTVYPICRGFDERLTPAQIAQFLAQ